MKNCCNDTMCGCGKNNCDCSVSKCNCKGNCNCSGHSTDSKAQRKEAFERSIKTISAEELLKKMDKDSALILINVLSEEYYNKCHIKGSINVPLDHLQGVALESWNPNDKIVVYCANYECPASRNAFKILEKLGFTQIAAYEGGIKEWCQKKYPVVGDCSE